MTASAEDFDPYSSSANTPLRLVDVQMTQVQRASAAINANVGHEDAVAAEAHAELSSAASPASQQTVRRQLSETGPAQASW